MSTLAESEEVIVLLPAPQVDELAVWFERLRVKTPEADFWLARKRFGESSRAGNR